MKDNLNDCVSRAGLPIHSILNVELDHSTRMKLQALEQTFIHSKRPKEK